MIKLLYCKIAKLLRGHRQLSVFAFILLIIALIPAGLFAQKMTHIESKGDYFHVYSLEIDSGKLTTIELPLTVTGMSLQIGLNENFEGTYVINGNEKIEIHPNTHDKETKYEGKYVVSELILFDPAISTFQLFSSLSSGKLIIHLYNAGRPPKPEKKKHADADSLACSKPKSIDQSVWRNGLPAPTVNPTFTETAHVVIHHTAGSNTNTDHLSAIRSIYLYHTQTNGWDDIGYNYVIARDGTIYDGRDGLNQVVEDFVKGAHFCGKNANTMGISVMGTYTDETPPDTAIESLVWLLSWKLHKDQLNPLDSSIHPQGSSEYLPVICGHQDGCATECPGHDFHAQFPDIRNQIWQIIQNCPPVSIAWDDADFSISVFPQPASDYLNIQLQDFSSNKSIIHIHDLSGKLLLEDTVYTKLSGIDISGIQPGLYVLTLVNGSMYYRKLIVKR